MERHSIEAITDGRESRQFLYVDDCARAIGTAMQHYNELEAVTDISSNQWVTLRQIAALIDQSAPPPLRCPASFPEVQAAARARVAPSVDVPFYRYWQPTVSLADGIARLFAAHTAAHTAKSKDEL